MFCFKFRNKYHTEIECNKSIPFVSQIESSSFLDVAQIMNCIILFLSNIEYILTLKELFVNVSSKFVNGNRQVPINVMVRINI